MKPIILHTCYEANSTARPFNKEKCRCRKRLSREQAEFLLEHSFAFPHNSTKVQIGVWEKKCEVCMGDKVWSRSCQFCGKKGIIATPTYRVEYSGDIVLGNLPDEYGQVTLSKQAKTTRVDCLTKADMERAYIDGREDAIAKINEFGAHNVEVLEALMVPFRDDPFEGRPLFYSPAADERTSVGINR